MLALNLSRADSYSALCVLIPSSNAANLTAIVVKVETFRPGIWRKERCMSRKGHTPVLLSCCFRAIPGDALPRGREPPEKRASMTARRIGQQIMGLKKKLSGNYSIPPI